MQKAIELTKKLNDATRKVFIHFRESLQAEARKIKCFPEIHELLDKNKSSYQDTSELVDVKRKFGEIFYGVLCPINGVSPKNRRYPDGDWELDKENYRDIEGPCVWKKIGTISKWSTRIQWYDSRQVFDHITQDHIDKIHNGTVNRKTQEQMAQDLYDSKCYMSKRMNEIKEFSEESKLSKIYNVKLIVLKDHPGVEALNLEINTEIDSNHNDYIPGLPIVIVDAKIDSISISGNSLTLQPTIDPSTEKMLKDKYSIDVNYQFRSGLNMNLVDMFHLPPKGNLSWNDYYYITDIDQIFQDPQLSEHFNLGLKLKQEVVSKLEEVNTTYAGQLLANGIF